jgi:hypothetical protein
MSPYYPQHYYEELASGLVESWIVFKNKSAGLCPFCLANRTLLIPSNFILGSTMTAVEPRFMQSYAGQNQLGAEEHFEALCSYKVAVMQWKANVAMRPFQKCRDKESL